MAEMDMKEKLVELLNNSFSEQYEKRGLLTAPHTATDLIAHGVMVQEWIPASEPPTLKDADKYGRVLAMEMGMMALVNYKGLINYPDRFPYWMPLPKLPKGE